MSYPVITFHEHVYGYRTDVDPDIFEWRLYCGIDYSNQEDITVITHTVACCRCGKNEVIPLKTASDFIYLDDILKELGWEKDKYNRWLCNDCSYKGGDD